MKIPKSILIGSILMILLGLARGVGGLTLLMQGKSALPNIIASESTIRILAVGLIMIGVLEIISAVGVLRLKRFFWIFGIAVTLAFVIDGAINGYFLFGKSGEGGTIVNSLVAIFIIGCLWIGRNAFAKSEQG